VLPRSFPIAAIRAFCSTCLTSDNFEFADVGPVNLEVAAAGVEKADFARGPRCQPDLETADSRKPAERTEIIEQPNPGAGVGIVDRGIGLSKVTNGALVSGASGGGGATRLTATARSEISVSCLL
jgi:hypothetical protein